MKSQWEQDKPAPGTSKWSIDKRVNNETQWSRSNLETTLWKVSQGGFKEGIQELEAKRWKDQCEEAERFTSSKRANQRNN